MIGQCAVAAGVAWIVGQDVLQHSTPFFAPIVAVVCLGTTYGQRQRRIAEVMVGVTVGIGVGDAFTHVFGRGEWQISVVVVVAMTAAILLDAGTMLTGQATVQSIVVVTILPVSGGLTRIEDALVGGAVALVAATVVPGAPLRRPREEAAKITEELARLLQLARQSAGDVNEELASDTLSRARETASLFADLRTAASEGVEVVRTSPFRRHTNHRVRPIAGVVEPLDSAIRNTRVLIRRIVVSARLGETMPPDYLDLLDALADASKAIAEQFAANRPPDPVRPRLVTIAEATSRASEPLTLSAAVVLGQMRTLTVDLLQLTGADPHEAVALVPNRR